MTELCVTTFCFVLEYVKIDDCVEFVHINPNDLNFLKLLSLLIIIKFEIFAKLQVCISNYTLSIGYLVIFFILEVYCKEDSSVNSVA